jgi:4,5-dihydroxyphthalate decarboxylase
MKPRLTLSCGEYKRTRPLLDGRVQVEGYHIEVIPDPFPASGILGDYQYPRTLRMLDEKAFDICEMGMAPLVTARSQGIPLVAIPVFHYRRFRHPYIFCRGDAGIEAPQDLAGRRVGVRRLNLSAGLWARALLQHDHGIPLNEITWVVAVDVPLREEVRNGLKLEVAPPGTRLEELLADGHIDAMIEASALSVEARRKAGVRRLLGEDTRQQEVDYYKRTSFFPIMHTVALWQEHVAEHPELCEALYQAFVESRTLGNGPDEPGARYILAAEEEEWWQSLTLEQREIMCGGSKQPRDPWIYSLEEDGKTVNAFLDYAHEQGLTPERYLMEDLFVW